MTPEGMLQRGLSELGFRLPQEAPERLLQYLALLEKWNRTYNLTAIRDPLEMVSHHLLDSLVVTPHLPMPPGAATLADVGAGAGLPGIPLALARPDWHVTLNDSNTKKSAFLRQAAIELRLSNVAVHEGRVEAWQPATRFAVVISRAFAEFTDFVARCRHLVAPEGVLAAMKSTVPPDMGHAEVLPLKVPLLQEARCLVLWRAKA